jgi:hypothetical protein
MAPGGPYGTSGGSSLDALNDRDPTPASLTTVLKLKRPMSLWTLP